MGFGERVATAPGKMMVCGEYAVLHRAPSVVVAVDRRAEVTLARSVPLDRESSGVRFPEALASFRCGEEVFGSPPPGMKLGVDVSSLRRGEHKLGLGSSAASAAAAAGLACAASGNAIEDRIADVLNVAMEGHRRVSPSGSGADVAAAVLGGFVRFQRLAESVDAQPADVAEGMFWSVIWTGEPASTRGLVAKVNEFRERDPSGHARIMAELTESSHQFCHALSTSCQDTIDAIAAYHEGMKTLGELAGAPIVEYKLDRVAHLAERFGGSSKPSGAGGGDVALALFLDAESRDAFEESCATKDLTPVSLKLGEPGVRIET